MTGSAGPSPAPLAYMRQLDGVRAIAVLAVLYWHLFPPQVRDLSLGHWAINPGHLGVSVFFVLSGFLITGILLKCRDAMEPVGSGGGGGGGGSGGGQSLWFTARQFYMRRVLRIFPLFYVAIALTAWLDVPPMRETLWWHASYLTNVLFAVEGRFMGAVSPFWSLAVEEQFYLVWPWLVLTVPRRWLGWVMVGTVASAPALRWALLMVEQPMAAQMLTPACLDRLGGGALLAWVVHRGGPGRLAGPTVARWAGLGGAACVLAVVVAAPRLDPLLGDAAGVLEPLGAAGLGLWVIDVTSRGVAGPVGWALAHPVLVYLGRISYGLYVIHNFVPHLTPRTGLHPWVWAVTHGVGSRAGLSEATVEAWTNGLVFPLLWVGLSVALAAASWHSYEAPLNALKRWFPYRRPGQARQAGE